MATTRIYTLKILKLLRGHSIYKRRSLENSEQNADFFWCSHRCWTALCGSGQDRRGLSSMHKMIHLDCVGFMCELTDGTLAQLARLRVGHTNGPPSDLGAFGCACTHVTKGFRTHPRPIFQPEHLYHLPLCQSGLDL